MSQKILSAAVIGLDAEIVEVESDTGGQYGVFSVVGLPDAAVQESRERVKSAIKNSGFDFPKIKVTVNLAPADLKKHGPSYDLPIAVSILATTGKILPEKSLDNSIFLGELALNGDVRPINGVLPVAIQAEKRGYHNVYVPRANAAEAKLVKNLNIFPIDNLTELVEHLSGTARIEPLPAVDFDFSNAPIMFDMSHIRGQEHVKRAMEIAAAGAHNMFMFGTISIL